MSFQWPGDRAGLTNITVISFNLSLLRISSGCQPKWKTDGPKALFCSTMTDVGKELEIFREPLVLEWPRAAVHLRAAGAQVSRSWSQNALCSWLVTLQHSLSEQAVLPTGKTNAPFWRNHTGISQNCEAASLIPFLLVFLVVECLGAKTTEG